MLFALWFSLSFLLLPTAEPPVVEWLTPDEHDFGTLSFGDSARHVFHFRNISEQALRIDNIRPACGCTTSDWDDTPVAPDSTGHIRVIYDARDEGYFYKKIKVYFNLQRKPEILWLEGDVVKSKK